MGAWRWPGGFEVDGGNVEDEGGNNSSGIPRKVRSLALRLRAHYTGLTLSHYTPRYKLHHESAWPGRVTLCTPRCLHRY